LNPSAVIKAQEARAPLEFAPAEAERAPVPPTARATMKATAPAQIIDSNSLPAPKKRDKKDRIQPPPKSPAKTTGCLLDLLDPIDTGTKPRAPRNSSAFSKYHQYARRV
jgi:hypothetical protein